MLPTEIVYGCIGLGLAVTAVVIGTDRKQRSGMVDLFTGDGKLVNFQRLYLFPFLLAMLADWLQGPFIYALYESYGIDRQHNGYLFVAGFGASAVFGTVVGSAADQCGRKKFALLYCVTYLGHCISKHTSNIAMLMAGRILGGISTSLLFSVFDAWLVSESQRLGFGEADLGNTFSIAYFGSSIAAIAAGELGEVAADVKPLTEIGGNIYYGGFITPFDLANWFLILCMFSIARNWSENYGQTAGNGGTNFTRALKSAVGTRQVLLCGLIASSFESSMYIFVFNWTPCLMEEGVPHPPFGHVFSCFMIMCMLGSRVFALLSRVMSLERIGFIIVAVSAASHLVVVLTPSVTARFFAFLVFEACVGLYFPMMGTLKGDIVPEDMRSTIYNIYRCPLNVAVVLPLVFNFGITTAFVFTTCLLAFSLVCQCILIRERGRAKLARKSFDDLPEIGLASRAQGGGVS